MATFEDLEEDFSVSDDLFEVEVDLGAMDTSIFNTAWFQYYEQPFPPVVRHLLKDIMDNWVKLEYYARDDPAFAERVLSELQSKANKLPISDVTQVSREEITKFVRKHSDNPSLFLEMINDYCNKELTGAGEYIQSNLVLSLWKASYDLKKKLTSIQQRFATEQSISFSEELKQEICAYYQELTNVVKDTSGIKDYVQQTLQKLRKYQAEESECEKFYVKEMADMWEKLLLTIENLFWQVKEISKLCEFSEKVDVSPLETALEELVSSSVIIVESPRLNERTLRVKKKKVTYALQIILPEVVGAANVRPYLLSEEGYMRLNNVAPSEEPLSTDLGTSTLFQKEQPVIKDPNSNQYRCVFNELGFESMSRERKRARSGSVMTIKLVYMFRVPLNYGGRQIWSRCFSMPVVTSSHNGQAVQGTATLFWDTYFPLEDRVGLQVRTKVSWTEIGSALKNLIFRQTGRRITELNLRFLRSVFLGKRRDEAVFDEEEKLFQLCDLLHPLDGTGDQSISFWDWVWGTLSMLTMKENKFLLNLWRNGYLVGYISQENATEVIRSLLNGVNRRTHFFLLRFSKRECKAIVLQGFIEGPDPSNQPLGIFSVLPYKAEHLRETPLEQRIMKRRDCQRIVYEDVMGGWSCEQKEKIFEPDEHVRRLTKLPTGYVDREMSECTPQVAKSEAVETEMVIEELDVTSRIF